MGAIGLLVPSEENQLATSSENKQTSSSQKACGAMDARDKPASFNRMKDKYQLKKNRRVSPRAHEQGSVPLGLPYRSLDRSQKKKGGKKTKQKPAFQRVWGFHRVFLSSKTPTKQTAARAAPQTLVAVGPQEARAHP